MSVNDYSLQSKLPSGRNTSLLGLNLVTLAALSPFWLPLVIDGYDFLTHKQAQPFSQPREMYIDDHPLTIEEERPLMIEEEGAFVSKSRMRIYAKAEGVLPINGLCWFDIVNGHGRKVGGERAECDRADRTYKMTD